MRPHDPPAVAVWMLEHVVPGNRKEALAGDLLEEFRHGRTAGWYWRQVLGALLVGCFGELWSHWLALSVTIFWTVTAPLYKVYFVRWLSETAGVSRVWSRVWSLPWPYSTICDLAFNQACGILYLWSALATYFLLSATALGSLNPRRLVRGMWINVLAYVVVSAAMMALFLANLVHGVPIDVRQVTPLALIADLRWIVFRADVFLPLLVSLWMSSPSAEQRRMRKLS